MQFDITKNRLPVVSAIALLTSVYGTSLQAADATGAMDEVVVTGSRLSTSTFTTPTPTTVVDEKMIQERAPATMLEVLYQIPTFKENSGPTASQRFAMGGTTSSADLRGLSLGGVPRTLTLVNGRRQIGSGGFDTGRIPVSLVKRVDVVTGGASAAYGSDAVAGVVNFILDDSVVGLKGNVQYGVSQEGDDETSIVDLAGGLNFAGDRGHVMGDINYAKGEGVGNMYSRDWGAREPGIVAIAANLRGPGVPAQGYFNNVEFSAAAPGGVITGPATLPSTVLGQVFNDNGTSTGLRTGCTISGTTMIGCANNYGNQIQGGWKLTRDYERYNALGRVTFDIMSNLTFEADATYTSLYSEPNFGAIQSSLTIQRDNPFVPATLRSQLVTAGVQNINLGVLFDNFNPKADQQGYAYQLETQQDTLQVNVGLKGKIGDWNWDTYYARGKMEFERKVLDAIYTPNLLAATHVVLVNGVPTCGPNATNPVGLAALNAPIAGVPGNPSIASLMMPGCQPYNAFGPHSFSQAALDYIRVTTISNTEATQDVIAANISGELFDLWAGPLAVAAGLEYRKEESATTGEGYNGLAILFGGTANSSGSDSVKEGYLELGLPVLSDMFLKGIDLNGAIRHTDYKYSGEVDTWKLGMTIDATDWVRLRGTVSHDIRAPSLGEMFAPFGRGVQNGFVNPFTNTSGPLFITGQGNPDLLPEEADTMTFGIVLTPTNAASGFKLSVDYYEIKVDGVIGAVAAGDIVRRCYDGLAGYCNLVNFDAAMNIESVNQASVNLNKLQTSGLDIELTYDFPLGNLPGNLTFRGLANKTYDYRVIDNTGVGPQLVGYGGGMPDWSLRGSLGYSLQGFSGTVQARYVTGLRVSTALVGPDDPAYNPANPNSTNHNYFGGQPYYNLSLRYDMATGTKGGMQFYLNVDNLMNTDPPDFAPLAFSGLAIQPYDLVGRTFRGGVRFSF